MSAIGPTLSLKMVRFHRDIIPTKSPARKADMERTNVALRPNIIVLLDFVILSRQELKNIDLETISF